MVFIRRRRGKTSIRRRVNSPDGRRTTNQLNDLPADMDIRRGLRRIFFVSLTRVPINYNDAVEFAVRSLGQDSKRWFALDKKQPDKFSSKTWPSAGLKEL